MMPLISESKSVLAAANCMLSSCFVTLLTQAAVELIIAQKKEAYAMWKTQSLIQSSSRT